MTTLSAALKNTTATVIVVDWEWIWISKIKLANLQVCVTIEI